MVRTLKLLEAILAFSYTCLPGGRSFMLLVAKKVKIIEG